MIFIVKLKNDNEFNILKIEKYNGIFMGRERKVT